MLYFFVGFSWGQFLKCLDSCILHLNDGPMFLQLKYYSSSRRKLNGSIFTVLCLLIIIIVVNVKSMKSIFITNTGFELIIKWSVKIVKPVGEHPQWFSLISQDFETFTPLNPLKLYFGMLFALIRKAIGVNINSLR